ncbi:hypothetical protein ACTVH1_18330 [Gluconobacter cerinus]
MFTENLGLCTNLTLCSAGDLLLLKLLDELGANFDRHDLYVLKDVDLATTILRDAGYPPTVCVVFGELAANGIRMTFPNWGFAVMEANLQKIQLRNIKITSELLEICDKPFEEIFGDDFVSFEECL